ncbi:MAG: peptide deformylase [Epsilonproteobacteria bacterium]|nr:hypothetical protein [Campylobacterota bacterium]NPA56586.1 peptide deformylase [Campylobacterota bacterium]
MAEILTYPDQRLLQISGLVRDFKDPQLDEIIDELKRSALERNLKGLAAIQIGIPLRIILFRREGGEWEVMINPAIYGKEGEYFPSTERDESLPGAEVTVRRYPTIKVAYEDREGNTRYYTAHGEESVWLQRKIDMVFGGYLFDKLDKKGQREFFRKYGSYGDTCPTYFVKDRILTGLRLFLILHLLTLLAGWVVEGARRVMEWTFPLLGVEILWLLIYVFYARYETKKYKNCTSCQNANILGTAGLYLASILLIFLISLLLKRVL